LSEEEEKYLRLVSPVTINRETVDCKPNESQMEFDANESYVVLASVASTLTMESMLTRILSKVCVATYLPQDCDRKIAAMRHSQVTAEELAKKWRVGIDTARQTLKVTTQLGVRTAVHPFLMRQYRTDHFTLRYKRLNETFYADMMFAMVKSLKGNKCAQVFSAKDFLRFHPTESKAECNQALQTFAEDVGIPADLVTDGEQRRRQVQIQTLGSYVESYEKVRESQNHIHRKK
jgi:hypothetical protein